MKNRRCLSVDEVKGRPNRRGGATKGAWSHATEGDLPKSRDHKQKRSDLAQKRDAIARDDVEMQIKNFFR